MRAGRKASPLIIESSPWASVGIPFLIPAVPGELTPVLTATRAPE